MTNQSRLSDKQFVDLLTSAQVRLRAYSLSLVRNSTDADDALQRACLALWEKRADYDADRDFFPWACGIVLIEILRFRRKKATDKLLFGEVLINALATDYLKHVEELDGRRAILPGCLEKLSDDDRGLIELRYSSDVKPKEISSQRGTPVTTIYSALSRIREALHRCIESSLAQHAHPKQP